MQVFKDMNLILIMPLQFKTCKIHIIMRYGLVHNNNLLYNKSFLSF